MIGTYNFTPHSVIYYENRYSSNCIIFPSKNPIDKLKAEKGKHPHIFRRLIVRVCIMSIIALNNKWHNVLSKGLNRTWECPAVTSSPDQSRLKNERCVAEIMEKNGPWIPDLTRINCYGICLNGVWTNKQYPNYGILMVELTHWTDIQRKPCRTDGKRRGKASLRRLRLNSLSVLVLRPATTKFTY